MADIVSSRKMESSSMIIDLKSIVNYINTKWEDAISSPLTITLGDEFQSVIKNREYCYLIIFDIEEYMVKYGINMKLRYVVHYGEIDTEINKLVAHEMYGSGLTIAREELTRMKSSSNRFHINVNKTQEAVKVINDLFLIYESYVDSWKTNAYYIVTQFLDHSDYKIVANNLEINVASAWKRFKSLNIKEYKLTKDLILKIDKML